MRLPDGQDLKFSQDKKLLLIRSRDAFRYSQRMFAAATDGKYFCLDLSAYEVDKLQQHFHAEADDTVGQLFALLSHALLGVSSLYRVLKVLGGTDCRFYCSFTLKEETEVDKRGEL
jgi:hypothetical protein